MVVSNLSGGTRIGGVMKRALFLSVVFGATLLPALSASAGTCDPSSIVLIYEDSNFSGGCIGLSYGAVYDFPSYTFDNGNNLNDAASSVIVASGWRVIMYTDTNLTNSSKDFVGNVSFVGGLWNDLFSSYSLSNDTCPQNARIRAYTGVNFSGGCKSFDSGDVDFDGNSFDDGSSLNDAISSISVSPGYRAHLYSDSYFGGEERLYIGDLSNLSDFGGVASSLTIDLAPPDYRAPTVRIDSSTSRLIAGVSHIFGTASDDASGVATVALVFENSLPVFNYKYIEANLTCSPGRLACDWDVVMPLTTVPGSYVAHAEAVDVTSKVGFSEYKPSIIV